MLFNKYYSRTDFIIILQIKPVIVYGEFASGQRLGVRDVFSFRLLW